jgi:protein TonB
MPQILDAARQVDEHFTGGLFINRDGEAVVYLTLATPPLPQPTPPQVVPDSTTPQRIRVGGVVQQANLIRKVTPAYPPDAKEARIQGVVHLTAIIGKDGSIQSLEVVSGHPLLVQAAMDAVKQWEYKPTLLNGNPVEVVTQIDVNFTLSQ